MNGIGQLFKGILIGLVLLLAVVGLLKISGKTDNPELPTPTQADIPAPSISINSPSSTTPATTLTTTNTGSTASSTLQPSLNESKEASTEKDAGVDNTKADIQPSQATFKPEIVKEPISYGTLNLNAKQKVEFLIFDENNKRVAASKNNVKASFHLPVGQYTVITLLGSKKETQTIDILKDQISNANVSIQSPIITGTLKVAAISAKSKQSIKTTFSIHDSNGKLVGKRQDVASSLFKLDAGTYKITATHDDMSDTRTVIVEAGASSQEIFSLEKSTLPSEVLVKAIEEGSNKPVQIDLIITTKEGKKIKELRSISNAKISLKAGEYRISATSPREQSSRYITLKEGDIVSETFRFKPKPVEVTKVPVITPPDAIPPTEIPVVSAPPVIVEPVVEPVVAPVVEPIVAATVTTEDTPLINIPTEQPVISETIKQEKKQGTLKLSSISSNTKKPVKSNFYVQTKNGKHITKKIYADSARFELDKGTYKITIKSKNMKTITKTVTVDADRKLNHIFSMHGIMTASASAPIAPKTTPEETTATTNNQNSGFVPLSMPTTDTQTRNTPARQIPSRNTQATNTPKPNTVPAFGSLVFDIRRSSRNTQAPRNAFLSDFTIKTKSGKKIAQINKVQHATVKLDVGEYVITANHRGRRKSKSFKINNSRATKISFKTSDFSSFKPQTPVAVKRGILRSKVVDNNGRPLKGNISVTDQTGKQLHRANNVSTALFHLPANKPYTVHINYQGLKGSERIKIIAGETTVQTFTIADTAAPQTRPNRSRNTPQRTMP